MHLRRGFWQLRVSAIKNKSKRAFEHVERKNGSGEIRKKEIETDRERERVSEKDRKRERETQTEKHP